MISSRKLRLTFLIVVLVISACSNSISTDSITPTARPNATEKSSEQGTSVPAVSTLNINKESLRGKQVSVWYPWFGSEASLFESQVTKFNQENEWGIVI